MTERLEKACLHRLHSKTGRNVTLAAVREEKQVCTCTCSSVTEAAICKDVQQDFYTFVACYTFATFASEKFPVDFSSAC